jgi:acyl transferase domain-containing protein/acyl carrier protein
MLRGAPPATAPKNSGHQGPLFERTLDYLADIFVAVLKVDRTELRPDEHFDRYGMESLSALEIRDRIATGIGGLSPTLLFEHNTLARLAAHLVANHREPVAALLGDSEPQPVPAEPDPPISAILAPAPSQTVHREMPIAIVGVSGRYPGAPTLDPFWRLLVAGRGAIAEVPADRWNADAYFDPTGKDQERAYTKWGAFIADADKFDPLFFGIAPLEAETMDPQERLFLETAWAVLEDAGYTPARLRQVCARSGAGEDVGVFVGVMNAAYQWLAVEAWQRGNPEAGASAYWSIANRVSYLFDFCGPSLAIDSACSSSLTAIHLACESIRRGECGAAIAGGVNLILHPRQFINLSRARMVSRGDECRVFGEGADGFVDGEGVGAVLLRPLADAERDGDRIEAIILGSAVNAGGRTGGYTVPNPEAQARVVTRAMARAGVEPASIGYIEAHGTGTALGDPIEIAGLKLAFGKANTARCAIGSVKANIGHLESAAGIAGVTKVILQFRHKTLAPAPYAAHPNPLIDFAGSPFALPPRATAWERGIDAGGDEIPRRAGISSFGAGGANAHVILEEYRAVERVPPAPTAELVVLSARSRERLVAQARALLASLEAATPADPAQYLADLAHTLRRGREPMAHRLAIVAGNLAALRARLSEFAAGRDRIDGAHIGAAEPRLGERALMNLPETRTAIDGLFARRELDKLARLWVEGNELDWTRLPVVGGQRILSLPTYPFRRERYSIVRHRPTAEPAAKRETASNDKKEATPALVMLNRVWRDAPAMSGAPAPGGTIVVCTQDREVYEQAVASSGRPTVWVRCGHDFSASSDGTFGIAPDDAASAAALLDHLRRSLPPPYRFLQLWRWMPTGLSSQDALLASFHLVQAAAAAPIDDFTLIHAVPAEADGLVALDGAAAAFARTAMAEHPGLEVALVAMEPGDTAAPVARCLMEADIAGHEAEIHYRDGRRLAPTIERLAATSAEPGSIGFRARGVYVLVGGLGEVGAALARELLKRYRIHAVILGRSPFDGEVKRRVAELKAFGGEVLYLSCDVADRAALDAAVALAKQRFGAIHGVLHLARAIDPASLAALSTADFLSVLSAKVAGTINLDAALADEPLDFFVTFSSLAAWQALPGAAAYAAACAFQDAFASTRARRVADGTRVGRSVSICWPQWAYDDYFDTAKAARLRTLGLHTLDAAAGLLALDRALACGASQVGFLLGDERDIDRLLAGAAAHEAPCAATDAAAVLDAMSEDELAAYLAYLRNSLAGPTFAAAAEPTPPASVTALADAIVESFSTYLRIAPDDIGRDSAFADLGLDSIKALHIAESLQRRIGKDVAPAMFFEHPTAAALARALSAVSAATWAQIAE